MKSRRSFLAAVASGSAGMSLAALDPVAAATPKPPTSQAVALATAMQRFDPNLTPADVQTIAQAIDANNVAAQVLNPKKKRLKNGDAPVVRFTVPGGEG